MKTGKKFLAMLLSLAMVFSMMTVNAFAAGGATNVAYTIDKTEALPGEEVVVVLSNNAMNVSSFTCGISFDKDKLEVKSITAADPAYPEDFAIILEQGGRNPYVSLAASTVAEANNAGTVGFGVAQTDSKAFVSGVIATIVFTVKADATGSAAINMYEDTAGTDAFKSDAAGTGSVTIKGAAHEHSLTQVPAKAATCKEAGNNEYYTCECGMIFKADKTTETTVEAETLAKLTTHTWGDWVVTKPATEEAEGSKTRTCSVCGETETEVIAKLPASGDDTTGGDNTGDDNTGDSTTGDTTTGGSTTGGSTTGGSTTGGTTTGGTTTGGSTTGGSTTGGTTTGGEPTPGIPTDPTPNTPTTPTTPTTPVEPGTGFKYIDVNGHWCEDLIYKWTAMGVINGVGDNMFDPDGLLTRAQAAAIFSRWLGLEKTADISCFVDIPANAWYAEYVAECYAAGIVKGKAADKFAPNDYITRAEMFTMLCRALEIAGEKELNKYFTDADQIPAWAAEYTYALVNNGYVSGMTETTLAPLSNLTRAQMVKLMDNVNGLVK